MDQTRLCWLFWAFGEQTSPFAALTVLVVALAVLLLALAVLVTGQESPT